jgi:uncharacterized protein YcbK (DUF882 family)
MVTEKDSQYNPSRRSFLLKSTQIILGLGVVSVPTISCAKVLEKRSLSFFHTRAQQELTITYASGKTYDPKALTRINRFLRDYQTGQIHVIDPKLLDILWALQGEMGRKGVYEVISGYRSPKTNKGLRRSYSGVANRSLHMKGQAIDIRYSGGNIAQIHECAVALASGGVGYYPKAGFVHLDSGQYRTW